MPIGFALIAVRLVWRSSEAWWGRGLASIGLLAGLLVGQYPGWLEGIARWPGLLLLIVATLLGSPIFAALGGAALLLFLIEGVPAAAVPVDTYRLVVSPTLPAIPLFTLAGFLLVFIPAVGEFIIPELLGGSDTLMIGKTLWTEFFSNRDWPLASAVAVVLLLLLVVPIVIFQHTQARNAEASR
jgi:ABC-type Fe3+ transport system permease subunit